MNRRTLPAPASLLVITTLLLVLGVAPRAASAADPLPMPTTGYMNPCDLFAKNGDIEACVDKTNKKVTFKRFYYSVQYQDFFTSYTFTSDVLDTPDAIAPTGEEGGVIFPALQKEFGFVVTQPNNGQIAVFDLTQVELGSKVGPPITYINVPSLYGKSTLTASPSGAVYISLSNGGVGVYSAFDAVYTPPAASTRPSSLRLSSLPAVLPTPPGAANPPNPLQMVNGSDGNLYFTETSPTDAKGNPIVSGQENIGQLTPAGVYTQFPVPTPFAGTADYNTTVGTTITAGPDGNIWFLETTARKIAQLVTTGSHVGQINEFPLPATASTILGIGAGADGNLWVKDYGVAIYRVTTDGTATSFPIPSQGSLGSDVELVPAPDGTLWFAEDTQLGRIGTTGAITEYTLPTGAVNGTPIYPFNLVFRSDGSGAYIEYSTRNMDLFVVPPSASPLVASILPSSRSVRIGGTATVFATMINSGKAAATACHPALASPLPAAFSYQTTDPATNAPTGSANTPVDIPAGGVQSFVLALTFNAAAPPTDTAIGFSCADADAAPIQSGVDTVLLSGSATPVPDVVALAATAGNTGTLAITGSTGSGAFAVATVNVGAGGSITATPSASNSGLPLSLSICQTDPTSGQCIAAPASSVTTTIAADATPTFAVFATASAAIPFAPASSRIAVQFIDGNGAIRGATSVAVDTQ